ncbi:MAG: hypothetical protein COB04_19135 [Gammaproteobacteria bacterium]|nr:MAG: hypothetical protein COB04_19135 [Gammaproteobacteria bacterium]
MNIDSPNKYGKATEEKIQRFESMIGCELPIEYRNYLAKYNGGKPIPSNFDLENEEGLTLHTMNSLSFDGKYYDHAWTYETFKGRIPKQLLPFGDDPGGNQICIGLKGKYKGKVYFWDHEEDNLIFKFKGVSLVAESFNEFIDGLYEYIDLNETEIDRILRTRDFDVLERLLENGHDIEQENEYGRTLIEEASISANAEFINFLYEKGAELRESIALAEQNAKFFEEHKPIVELLGNLKRI